MSETRYPITDIIGGRANSNTGQAEMDFSVGEDTVVLELDGDNLAKVLGLAMHLSRMPPSIPGEIAEIRAFPTEWWSIGHTPDKSELTLILAVAGGGQVGFRIPAEQAAQLYESMSVTMDNLRRGPG
jgi:hypothetical protein